KMLLTRSNEIYRAMTCESARWGASNPNPPAQPFTRNDWVNAMNDVANNFIPGRTAVLFSQLRADNRFPATAAPIFIQSGGGVANGYSLVITNPNPTGVIYYTTDGSDPRLRGALVNPVAIAYSRPITINNVLFIRARVKDGGNWSPLVEATFYPAQDFTKL